MPATRPRIVFTGDVCNACLYIEERKKIDWGERRQAFLDLVKEKKNNEAYDCIVPFSGGKDSATIAHRLKFELGLNPLLVTYGQMLWTDVGRHNYRQVINQGFDAVYWNIGGLRDEGGREYVLDGERKTLADGFDLPGEAGRIQTRNIGREISRKLARRFFIERGHPKQHYDAAVNAVPIITALDSGIPLVVFAEHGESFYGGHVLSEEHRRRRDLAEVLENQVGDDARNWAVDGITEKDLYPYIMPEGAESIEAIYYSWYFPWDIYKNAIYARSKMGFRQARNWDRTRHYADVARPIRRIFGLPNWWGKSDGSFEGFDSIDDMIDDLDYYMMYIKFLFGRSTRMAARLFQAGHIGKRAAEGMIERFDGEYPRTYLPAILDYLGMTESEMNGIVDLHRN